MCEPSFNSNYKTDIKVLDRDEELFAIVDHLGSGVLLADGKKPLYVNQVFAEIFGFEKPEDVLILDSYFDFVVPHDRERILGYAKARVSGQDAPIEYEFEGLRPDGSVVHVLNRPTSIHWKGKKVTLATIVDITKRKVAENKLAERNKQLRFLQNALDAHAIVSVTDTNGNITYVNDKFCEVSGWSREEMIGQKHSVLRSDDQSPQLFEDMWKTLRDGKIWQGEIQNKSKNGELYWVHTTFVPNLDETGRPFQYISIRSNITKERQALAEIQNREIFQRNIISTAKQGYWQIDNNQKTVAVNLALCQMLGYEESEMIGKSPLEFTSETKRTVLIDNFKEREKNDKRKLELKLLTRSGKTIDVILHATTLRDSEGNMSGSFAFVTDVTGQKLYEAQLAKAKAEAENANHAKSEFLAAMSHEIRTPMAGVLGLADFMLETNLTSEQRDWATSIRSSGSSLLTILNEILDQSKLEAGKLEIAMSDISLFSLVQEISQLFIPKIREQGLDFSIEFDKEVPKGIHADQTRIGQILSNLLSNALKFTPTGSISVKVESFVKETGQFLLRFIVTDTGIGLNEEAKTRIFNPFSQADSSTSRRYGGTGLGLSISKQLAELMGGEIGVDSKIDEGSSFWFTLSCWAAKTEITNNEIRPEKEPWAATKSLNILVAEDSLVNQQIITAILSKLGHQVVLAENGQKVLGLLKSGTFDIILMDIRMPVMDGLEATMLIRSMSDDYSTLPIIALTADISPENVNKYKAIGINDVCAKPLQLDHLLPTINKHLSQEIHKPVTDMKSTVEEKAVAGAENSGSATDDFSKILDHASKIADKEDDTGPRQPTRTVGLDGLDDQTIKEITERYEVEAIKQCEELASIISTLFDDPANEQERKKIKDIFHVIKGQSDTFGYTLFAKVAEDADGFLKTAGSLQAEDISFVGYHIKTLSLIARKKLIGDGGKAGHILAQGLEDIAKKRKLGRAAGS